MFWLLLLVVAILLFGAAAVRGFLGMVGFWVVGILFVILVFATFKYLLPEADAFDFVLLIAGIWFSLGILALWLKARDQSERDRKRRQSEEASLARKDKLRKNDPRSRGRKSLEESYKRKKQ